jgi:hypothetical protein
MFSTKTVIAPLSGILVGVTAVVFASGFSASPPAPQPKFEKWHIVEDSVSFPSGGVTVTRFHIISPEGDWFIVPPAYKEIVDNWVDGSVVQVPPHARMWNKPQDNSHGVPCYKLSPLELSDGQGQVLTRPVAVYNDLR